MNGATETRQLHHRGGGGRGWEGPSGSICSFFLFWPHSTWEPSFPYQGSNLCPLHRKPGVLTTGPPGNSRGISFLKTQLWQPLSLLLPGVGCGERVGLRPYPDPLGVGSLASESPSECRWPTGPLPSMESWCLVFLL